MKREKPMEKFLFLLIIDSFCNVLSFYLATFIRFGDGNAPFFTGDALREIVFILLLISITFHFIEDPSRNYMHRDPIQELGSVLIYSAFYVGLLVVSMFVIHHSEYLSRLQTGYFLVLNILLMFLVRTGLKSVIKAIYKSDNMRTNVVLIVDSANLSEVTERFFSGTTYHVCGIIEVDGDSAHGKVNDIELNSKFDDLSSSLVQHSFDETFIYLPDRTLKSLENLISRIEDMGAVCHYALNVSNENLGKGTLQVYGEFPVITYAINEKDHLSMSIKRLFDIFGSLIGLFFTGILFLFLAPVIKLESKGPVFFSQIRVGKNGRKFKFYKFRSMVVDAEDLKKNLMDSNEMSSSLMFKIENDPRVTKVGRFIRKTSLDEFPQFWNVFKGDMSLVGTRPPTVEEYEQYNEHYRRRLSMAPGITGLWQVSGRSSITDFNEVVKLDLAYIDNWSFKLDIIILLKTILVIFTKRGAS